MVGMASESEIRRKWNALSPILDERERRLWAGAEAEHSEDGIAAVERATGLSRTTIRAGRDELRGEVVGAPARTAAGETGDEPRHHAELER